MSISFIAPRHGIKARCKNDRIERVVGIGRTQPGGRDFFDRRASYVYQCDIVAIVRLIVVRIENVDDSERLLWVEPSRFGHG